MTLPLDLVQTLQHANAERCLGRHSRPCLGAMLASHSQRVRRSQRCTRRDRSLADVDHLSGHRRLGSVGRLRSLGAAHIPGS